MAWATNCVPKLALTSEVQLKNCIIHLKVLLIVSATQSISFAGFSLEHSPKMRLNPIDAPYLIEQQMAEEANRRIEHCWAKHDMSRRVLNFLLERACLNGYREAAGYRAVQIQLLEIVDRLIEPELKRVVGILDENHIEKIKRSKKWGHKGLPKATDSDPTYKLFHDVVTCVYSESNIAQSGQNTRQLKSFYRRRINSLQVAFISAIKLGVRFD